MAESKLVLFDIDCTLVDISSVHERAYREMFSENFNIDATYTDVPREDFAGKTTLHIIQAILKKHGFDEPTIANRLGKATASLNDKVAGFLNKSREAGTGRDFILEGIERLLMCFQEGEKFFLGSYTGGLRKTAEATLSCTGLNAYFPVRAFGDEGGIRNRTDIMNNALERARTIYSREFVPEDVYAFGDTIHDITSANELGVISVGVATGPYDMERLREENPKYLFRDLKDTQAVLKKLLKC